MKSPAPASDKSGFKKIQTGVIKGGMIPKLRVPFRLCWCRAGLIESDLLAGTSSRGIIMTYLFENLAGTY